ncbi:hypothetical protein [Micromonospora maris]|uniref:hypothetical protein n=1 Tax=Micromonospora maris TaxID=1003110 RepID=UPI000206B144|nr:hypothetical protein [Micromonospora maris]AEB44642.1 hypothetical protein VAB18032_17700 [Micromonospora maris AB-18-032]
MARSTASSASRYAAASTATSRPAAAAPGQRGRGDCGTAQPAAEGHRPAQQRAAVGVLAPQGGGDPGDQGGQQVRPRRFLVAAECLHPAGHLGVAVVVAGEADGLTGADQGDQCRLAVDVGQCGGGGQQGGQCGRGATAAQVHLTAQQFGQASRGSGHRRAGDAAAGRRG